MLPWKRFIALLGHFSTFASGLLDTVLFLGMLEAAQCCLVHLCAPLNPGIPCRKPVWVMLRQSALAALRSRLFTPVTSEAARRCLSTRSLGVARIRLLPKRNGALLLVCYCSPMGTKSTAEAQGIKHELQVFSNLSSCPSPELLCRHDLVCLHLPCCAMQTHCLTLPWKLHAGESPATLATVGSNLTGQHSVVTSL